MCMYFDRYCHFNSHTREGVTNLQKIFVHLKNISTHTPVRVWRPPKSTPTVANTISTHTPVRVWLCRVQVNAVVPISTHTPVRVWLDENGEIMKFRTISTHTPVRVWPAKHLLRAVENSFQLTHPWGCDYQKHIQTHRTEDFNSHTREGVTLQWLGLVDFNLISTHTPVRVWLIYLVIYL